MMDLRKIKKRLYRGRKRFRSRENTHYYSRKDFKAAEKQYLIECVLRDHCRVHDLDEPATAEAPEQTQKPPFSRRID